jgi:6-phosphogluconolactonase
VNRTVVVHPGGTEALAAAVAARLVTAVVDAVAARDRADVVLTGGSLGIALLAALRDSPAHRAVDWTKVHVWFGDERYLPAGDADRNETQAREALLDHLPLPEGNVHAVPAPGGGTDDVDAAAEQYARELAVHASEGSSPAVPAFDVLLLGVGPDGHVASLFPGLPGVGVTDRTVVGVTGSPKPPPLRVSLTLPAIAAAREVWFVAAGADKADAIAKALADDAEPDEVPASAPRGRDRTLWLLDEAVAARR